MATLKTTAIRVNFTKGRIDAFGCPVGKGQAFLWDAAAPGLGLRVTKAGVKAYIFQSRLHGRTLRQTIGSPDTWDIDDARVEARRLRVLVDSGIHPRDEKAGRKKAEEAARQEEGRATLVFADMWSQYVDARKRDWSEPHIADHGSAMQAPGLKRKRSKKLTVAGPLYALRGERLIDFTPALLAAWLENEKKTRPTVTARAYRLLRACLRWCDEQPQYCGLVDPATLLNGTVRRAVPRPQAKGDALQKEQLKPWFEAVQVLGNPVQRAYLQALLLTGARREEMSRLQWKDVDFQWLGMVIRDKVEGERIIPLTPYVAQVLNSLPRRTGNPWVFSSPTSASGRLADANHAHTRLLQAAGLPHVTLHGLRRSFGTLSEWVECPVGVVAQIQGHKPSALAEKHYRRRPLDLLRMWHAKIEEWILNEAGLERPADSEVNTLHIVK